jgi:hypothetical protein
MIKRTLGRSLVFLLVITGLAGTIQDNSISKKERKHAVSMMKDTKGEVIKSIENLSEAQLNFRPAEDQWSVKDCIYHIAATEKGLWSMLESSMKAPATPEKRAEIKITDEDFVANMKNRSQKFKTREAMEPRNSGYNSIHEAMADFKASRQEHIKYLKTTTEDMRNHTVQMPFGTIDCYQLALMVAAHSNRHVQQIEEVKAHASFPRQ